MSAAEQAHAIDTVLATATLGEKVAMMSGKGFFKLFKDSVLNGRPEFSRRFAGSILNPARPQRSKCASPWMICGTAIR